MSSIKKGTLYLIPSYLSESSGTEVLPPQISTAVKTTSIYLVENIRTARRYISSLKLGITIEELQFFELTKKTSREEIKRLLAPINKGQNIGILSEAGCPGIADPGALAVEQAHKIQARVVPLTGPSSILLGLMASGLNGQQFAFQGYLPIEKGQRVKAIQSLEKESIKYTRTQIFIETPFRNRQIFDSLLSSCKPETKLCVAVDITGTTEQIETHSIKDWKKIRWELHKRPTIFLLQG